MSQRIAVIGGGISGCAIAVRLAEDGHRVALFEAGHVLLGETTSLAAIRAHLGYMYPPQISYSKQLQDAAAIFESDFPGAVDRRFQHYYVVAREGSRTSSQDYVEFLASAGLAWTEEAPAFLKIAPTSFSARVPEALLNASRLRDICQSRLKRAGVSVFLSSPIESLSAVHDFDRVVISTYAASNALVGEKQLPLRFEVAERVLLKLPTSFSDKALTVIAGSYVNFAPFQGTEFHVVAGVTTLVHAKSEGRAAHIPVWARDKVNVGIVPSGEHTGVNTLLEMLSNFVELETKPEHIGSIFTIRAKLQDGSVDGSTHKIVNVDSRILIAFASKVTACSQLAKQVSFEIAMGQRENSQPRASP